MFYPMRVPVRSRATEKSLAKNGRPHYRKVGVNPPEGFVVLIRGLVQLWLAWGVQGSKEFLAGQQQCSASG